jgi:hypothetical protein
MNQLTTEAVQSLVDERMDSGFLYNNVNLVVLRTARAEAQIRLEGGYILEYAIDHPTARGPSVGHKVLSHDHDEQQGKLRASHPMMQKAYGDQHGPARSLDFTLEQPVATTMDSAEAALRLELPGDVLMRRIITLDDSAGLTIRTLLTNNSAETVRQRLGEHLYFSLPSSEVITASLTDRETPWESDTDAKRLQQGETLRVPGFGGHVEADFDGNMFQLDADARIDFADGTAEDHTNDIDMAYWHAADQALLCAEPLWGYDERGTNVDDAGFELRPGATATLQTTIVQNLVERVLA